MERDEAWRAEVMNLHLGRREGEGGGQGGAGALGGAVVAGEQPLCLGRLGPLGIYDEL
jgi:hypothetical protein